MAAGVQNAYDLDAPGNVARCCVLLRETDKLVLGESPKGNI